jgi:hypothetical protein
LSGENVRLHREVGLLSGGKQDQKTVRSEIGFGTIPDKSSLSLEEEDVV